MKPFEEILRGDAFQNHTCVQCGTHGALFATPHMFSACPHCLARRIRTLKQTGSNLPEWLLYLEGAAEREVQRQTEAEQKALSVSFDDFYKCGSCGKFIMAKDARYRIDPATRSSPPYCLDCYAAGRTE